MPATLTVPMADEKPRLNVPLPTLGGLQFWTDVRWRNGFRVQRNAFTKHYRLLSPRNIRLAWGSKSQCIAVLDERSSKPTSAGQSYVILVHGLMRSSRSMRTLERAIVRSEETTVIRFDYASSRAPMAEHATALNELLADLPATATFRFVGHSMGNIVIRRWLATLLRDGDPDGLLPRCRSMIMLGPPNQGATIARRLAPTRVFGWTAGVSAMQLGVNWDELQACLATPPFPFHILTGDVRAFRWHPLLDGPNDGIVSVAESKLDGAHSFELFPVPHGVLIYSRPVIERVVEQLDRS